MDKNPIKTDQVANISPFLVWVEDYRKLNFNDKSEFIDRFLTQKFGERQRQYGRGVFHQWLRVKVKTLPPLEVAKWCTSELKKMHTEIAALAKGEVVE